MMNNKLTIQIACPECDLINFGIQCPQHANINPVLRIAIYPQTIGGRYRNQMAPFDIEMNDDFKDVMRMLLVKVGDDDNQEYAIVNEIAGRKVGNGKDVSLLADGKVYQSWSAHHVYGVSQNNANEGEPVRVRRKIKP